MVPITATSLLSWTSKMLLTAGAPDSQRHGNGHVCVCVWWWWWGDSAGLLVQFSCGYGMHAHMQHGAVRTLRAHACRARM